MGIRVFYISEIVGKAGVWCVKQCLQSIRKNEKPDLVVANGDGVTGSKGLGRQHAGYLRKMGIDVITGGECSFYKKDLVEAFATVPYILRPANYPAESPGRGWKITTVGSQKVAIVSMIGRVGFSRVHGDNPFVHISLLAEQLRLETPYVLVDFHSGATAEKLSFFYHVDGKVSAVIGSHGRVQTSDETILPNGTAVITDAGRTGSLDSVWGSDPETKINEYVSGVPDWSRDCWEKPVLQGVVVDIDSDGKATSIRRVSLDCGVPPQAER